MKFSVLIGLELACRAAAAADVWTDAELQQYCEGQCANAGLFGTSTESCNQNPSCAMGCLVAKESSGAGSGPCSATCTAHANTCSWTVGGQQLNNCGACLGDYTDSQACSTGCEYFFSPPAPVSTSPTPHSQREHWAVIVAGSNGYNNYRHQADACHAYQIMRSKGIAADHIIVMAYDDVANNPQNPFPGKLFNKPTASGVEGVDVYEGCNIDYKGQDVNIANFVGVLTGTASGRSLKSTSEDNVFINFVDHGGPGLICFPGFVEEMHKVQLQQTLQTMSDTNMFHKLSFYLETCESGSMFEGLNIPNVYAVSAANPTQSSFGAYCGRSASVDGKSINSCLGDLFSINWMEDADNDFGSESLEDAWRLAHQKTSHGGDTSRGSEVLQWGDTSFTDDKSSEFIGNLNVNSLSSVVTPEVPKNSINVRQIDLNRLYDMYAAATTSSERLQVGEQLQQELARQMMVDLVHERLLGLLFPDDEAKQEEMRTSKAKPENMDCELRVHRAFKAHSAGQFNPNSAFALQFHQIVVNVCAEFSMANGATSMLESVVEAACSSGIVV